MPPLMQICVVLVTLGLLGVAGALIRAILRIERTMEDLDKLSAEVHQALVRVDQLAASSNELVVTLKGIVAPVQDVAHRLASVGERAAALGTRVLDEIEPPVLTAAAVSRGIKAGTSFFFGRIASRWFGRDSHPFGRDSQHQNRLETEHRFGM